MIGRSDDVVVTGGENVVASDVADVLSAHPDLADVAVTGVADPQWGQRLVAVVVVRDRQVVPSLADLRRWCSEKVGAAARPRGVVVVETIPRLASGKLDRLAVARLAGSPSGDAGD